MTSSTSKPKERREREAQMNSHQRIWYFRVTLLKPFGKYQTTKKFGTLPSNQTVPPGLPNDEQVGRTSTFLAQSQHDDTSQKQTRLNAGQFRALLLPETKSGQNNPFYAEPANATAHNAATILRRQLRNNPAPNKHRHREPGWLQTPAVVNSNPLHPIE